MDAKQLYNVVGAVIIREGQVLCAKRGDQSKTLAGYWEFPGGKIEIGETAEEALAREMREECRCDIKVGELVTTTRYEYDFAIINLTSFLCSLTDDSDEPRLSEHSELRWVLPCDMETLLWAPADREAVNLVTKLLGAQTSL